MRQPGVDVLMMPVVVPSIVRFQSPSAVHEQIMVDVEVLQSQAICQNRTINYQQRHIACVITEDPSSVSTAWACGHKHVSKIYQIIISNH